MHSKKEISTKKNFPLKKFLYLPKGTQYFKQRNVSHAPERIDFSTQRKNVLYLALSPSAQKNNDNNNNNNNVNNNNNDNNNDNSNNNNNNNPTHSKKNNYLILNAFHAVCNTNNSKSFSHGVIFLSVFKQPLFSSSGTS